MLPVLRADLPDTLILGIITVSALLAVTTVVLMFVRMQPTPVDEDSQRTPFDPVLLGSAVAVIALATIAFLTR